MQRRPLGCQWRGVRCGNGANVAISVCAGVAGGGGGELAGGGSSFIVAVALDLVIGRLRRTEHLLVLNVEPLDLQAEASR